MDLVFLLCTILIGVVTSVYLFFKYRFAYWKNQGVPYLQPSIPWGNLQGVGKPKNLVGLLEEIYFSFKNKASFAGAYFFASPVAIITDLDLLKDVLIKDFSSFHDHFIYCNEKDDPITGHLFGLYGEKWKRLRSILSPTFTSGKMKFMFPTLVEVSDRFVTTLTEQLVQNDEFEMKDLLARFTTDIIGTCAFGIECNCLKDPNAEFRVAGRRLVMGPSRYSPIVLQLLAAFPNVGRKLRIKITSDSTNDFFMGLVRETIKYREDNNVRRNDFMDMLIRLKNNQSLDDETGTRKQMGSLTIEEIAAQSFIFFLGGFETSATTMSFAVYELALNQELQEIARKEISTVLEKYDGKLTYEAMTEMKYVEQIIHETLRKYPPVPVLNRIATKDYPVPRTDKIIKKGQPIFIPVLTIHRDPTIYLNPDHFNPDRFSPEEEKKRHAMSFLSFGDGPRNCIGLRFGKMQSYVGLITLLKNFRIAKCSQTIIPLKIDNSKPILTAIGGLYVKLEKI